MRSRLPGKRDSSMFDHPVNYRRNGMFDRLVGVEHGF
jgi:hypothetical protein